MSKITLEGNASGTGTFTIAAPNSNTSYTLTLPNSSGTVLVSGGSQTIEFAAGSSSAPSITFTGDTNTGIFSPAADTIAFAEGGVEAMRINSSGNVGIACTDPVAKLDVRGILAVSNSAASYWGIDRNDSDGSLTFADGTTERMRIDSSGNVGIGVTPSSMTGTSSVQISTGAFLYGNTGLNCAIGSNGYIDSGTWKYKATGFGTLQSLDAATGIIAFYNAASGTAGNAITWNERARITSAGYFKASNTGSYGDATGTYHEFLNNSNTVQTVISRCTGTNYSSSVVVAQCNTNTSGEQYTFFSGGIPGVATRFQVFDSGTVRNSTGTYGTISDIKLKQDITDASSQWNDIKSLRIVNYRLKEYVQADPNAKPFLGLIAQEVEVVCPGLVSDQIDRDDEGNDLGTVTKAVKSSIIYMKAVKALQEAMVRIETLEAQNAAFEARLAALEAK